MNLSEKSSERLICDYLDGSLSEEDRPGFERRLQRDPAALDQLCSHALLASSLHRLALSTRHLGHQESSKLWSRQSRRSLGISVLAAAAIALVAGLVLYQIGSPGSRNTASIEVSPHTRFSLIGSEERGFSKTLMSGETLRISQGTVRVTLPDGSVCHAEAPAQLSMHSLNHLVLRGGLARFDIVKGSEGFRVTTSEMEVVDLGTAFGIDDRADRQPQVHVIDGSVRATSRSGLRESIILTAGQAAAVGAAGMLRPIPIDSGRFPGSLPDGLPALHFCFDPDDGGNFHASGLLASRAGVRIPLPQARGGDFPRTVGGYRGTALRFSGPSQRVATTWPGISGALPRTISLWMKIEPGTKDTGQILGWGLPGSKDRMSQFSLLYSGENLANLRIASGRRWLQSSTRLDNGEWNHLAVVLDSYTPGSWPSVKFYLNGKPEALTPRQDDDGDVAPLDSFATITDHPLSVPFTLGSFDRSSSNRSFCGMIDEVTLVAGILTEKQILALYRGEPEAAGLSFSSN